MSDVAGVIFFILFLALNATYEYIYTIAITTLEHIIGTILLIIFHICYVIAIKNLKFVENK